MKDMGEDPPVFQLPVHCLMSRPQLPLHHMLLRRIHIISWAFHLICVAAEALVSLDPLALFKEVNENFVEKCIFSILTGRVGFLDPHQVP